MLLSCAALAHGVEVPGTAGRVVAGGYLDGLAVAETEGGPRQRPQALGDAKFEIVPHGTLHGFLEIRSRIGGPFEGGSGAGVYNFDDAFQNYSPAVEFTEAWAELRARRAEVRVGVQRFAWGKLDGVPPTDVLNPRDYHDPLVADFEERKIGVPAVTGTYYLPDVPRLRLTELRATFVYLPIAVPSRLALADERWFPTSTKPPGRLVVPARVIADNHLPPLAPIPVTLETANDPPPRRLDAGGVALRLGGTWRDYDWDFYHYTGPETGPDADLRPELFLVQATPPIRLRAVSRLTQDHDTIHMTGADLALPVGGFTVRAEGAHFDDRPYLRVAGDLITPAALAQLPVARIFRQLVRRGHAPVPLGELFPARDAVEWGVGADYLWEGWQPLVQVNQITLLESAPRLVINDPETRLAATVRKRLLADRLEVEVRGVYAIERHAWYVFPRASYLIRDDLRVRLGYLAIGGPRASLIGQFRANDEFVMQIRYSF